MWNHTASTRSARAARLSAGLAQLPHVRPLPPQAELTLLPDLRQAVGDGPTRLVGGPDGLIEAAVADGARPDDLVSPGHVFPLRARKGGVLVRTGQTEGSVDLARLARTLSHEVMPGGWLHRHTCFVAANTLRGERRRRVLGHPVARHGLHLAGQAVGELALVAQAKT